VEGGPVRDVFYRPSHGYTVGLMNCTPRVDDIGRKLKPIEGVPPNLADPMPLCPFLPRCELAVPACSETMPMPKEVAPHHRASCHADLSRFMNSEKVA
jgi:oligopeptide/dipeptide ABC transporter ATP-binding protein